MSGTRQKFERWQINHYRKTAQEQTWFYEPCTYFIGGDACVTQTSCDPLRELAAIWRNLR
jgi:hypothetical protein